MPPTVVPPSKPGLTQRAAAAAGASGVPLVRLLSQLLGRRSPVLRDPAPPTSFPPSAPRTTPPDELERVIAALARNAPAWAATGLAERGRLAARCAAAAAKASPGAVSAAVAAKGAYESGRGEEAGSWSICVSILAELGRTLDALADGRSRAPFASVRPATGHVVTRVLPATLWDHLLYSGFTVDVWAPPGSKPGCGSEVVLGGPGGVRLVLGAGNHACVAVGDAAAACLVHGRATLVKVNPAAEWAGPHVEAALAPLVEAGACAVVYGGADVGKQAATHSSVESVHLTGSTATYDAIVWGSVEKKNGVVPPFSKRFTAELGNVTPVLIVPGGAWSASDIEAKAAEVVAGVAHNASANCLASKVLLLPAQWAHRAAFLAELEAAFSRTATRYEWYPGSGARYDSFLLRSGAAPASDASPPPAAAAAGSSSHARQIGAGPRGVSTAPRTGGGGGGKGAPSPRPPPRRLPWLLVGPAPLAHRGSDFFVTEEAWSPVLAIRDVDGGEGDVPAFLAVAADALNNDVWGTLTATVYIHPSVMSSHAAPFDAFVASLNYGNVSINSPSALSYFFTGASWGAAPGHTAHDIRSGCGPPVHNTMLVDNAVKSVLTAPWRPPTTSLVRVDHGTMAPLVAALQAHTLAPSAGTTLRMAAAAVRG